jgi:hypothetical protein
MTLWTDALNQLHGQMTQAAYDTVFDPTTADYNGNGQITIYHPSERGISWLEGRWRERIEAILARLAGGAVQVEFALAPAGDEPEPEEAEPEEALDWEPMDLYRPAYHADENGRLVYTTYRTFEGRVVSQERIIAPFTAKISQKLTIYGEQPEVVYTIEGAKGKRSFVALIRADEWADPRLLTSALLRYLPGKPPDTDPSLRRHWGPAISALTNESQMAEIRALDSTGWTPDGKAFVMPGGGYGRGYQCHLEAGLENEFQHFRLKKRTRAEEQKVVYLLFYGLPKVFRPSVVYTLLAHSFLPPLLRWVSDEARYLYHIHADTGSYKTELAKLIMALYGPTGTPAITYKWTNTPYGAESRAHALKDVLMVIDDLKPGAISDSEQAKWVAFVQAAVDAMGRKRATKSGRASVALQPRALLLSTGEAIPEAGESSYTARMLLAELNRQPSGRNRLLDRLKSKADLFNGLMYTYISWLALDNGQDALNEYKTIQGQAFTTTHARLSSNFASNRLGAVMLAKFCLYYGFLSQAQADQFLEAHLAGLTEIVERTAEKAQAERYSNRFMEGLHDAIGAGFASISNDRQENRVGWQSEDFVYLLNGAKDVVDQWLRSSGQTPINISKKELRHQLYDDGLTYSTGARLNRGEYDVQARDPMTDSYIMAIAIYRDKFFQAEPVHDLHDLHDLNAEDGNHENHVS